MRVASVPLHNGFVRLALAIAGAVLLRLARAALAIGAVDLAETLLAFSAGGHYRAPVGMIRIRS